MSRPTIISAEWIKHPSNPVLNLGLTDSWDDNLVGAAAILHDNGIFKMWYGGHDGLNWRIGHATSSDGVIWTKHNTFILEGLGDPANKHVHDPRVLIKDGKYYMWHGSSDQSVANLHINLVQSNDGLVWDPPLVDVLPPTLSWEGPKTAFANVIFLNDIYKMWYVAGGTDGLYRFGYATSDDGINWQKNPNPVFVVSQPWEGSGGDLGAPSVFFENGKYHMFYHGAGGIGYAISDDGLAWTKYHDNPVIDRSDFSQDFDFLRALVPHVLNINGVYYMWYTGFGSDNKWRIGLATSDALPEITPIVTSTPTPTLTPTITTTPIPTVTPTLSESSPIVIIPGLGASWNPRAIFSCSLETQGRWRLAPYAGIYQRLLDTLTENAHLPLNDAVYLYTYDWRLPIAQQGALLEDFIDSVLSAKPAGTKVKLVGHSLGGLVIRNYLENNPDDHDAEAVLTVGTPHTGTVDAYPVWEKGTVWSKNLLFKFVIEQVINHCRVELANPRLPTKKDVVHTIVPIINTLLPTFDYIKRDGVTIPSSSLVYQNDWIPIHPFPPTLYNTQFGTLSGDTIATLQYLNVVDPSAREIAAGDWLDGKPATNDKSLDGDGTVLLQSSQITGAENTTIVGSHAEIISSDAAIAAILAFLGISDVLPAEIPSIPEETSRNLLALSLDTPATLSITTPEGTTTDTNEQVFLRFNPTIGTYTLRVVPDISTTALVHVTDIYREKDSTNRTFKVKLTEGKLTNLRLTFDPTSSRHLHIGAL